MIKNHPPKIVVLKKTEIEQFWDRQWEVLEKRVDGVDFDQCWTLQQEVFKTYFSVIIEWENEDEPSDTNSEEDINDENLNDESLCENQSGSKEEVLEELSDSMREIKEIEAEIQRLINDEDSESVLVDADNDDNDISEKDMEIKDESDSESNLVEDKSNANIAREYDIADKEIDIKSDSEFVSNLASQVKEELVEKHNDPVKDVPSLKEEVKSEEKEKETPKIKMEQLNEPCTFCGFRAANFWTLKTHIEMIHLHLRYHCTVCKYNTKEKYILRGHIKKIHKLDFSEDQMNYECGVCHVKTSCAGFSDHIKEVHPNLEKFLIGRATYKNNKNVSKKCTFCNFTSVKGCILRSHVENVHLKTTFECDICNYSNLGKKVVSKHIALNHLPRTFILDDKPTLEGKQMLKTFMVTKCSLCKERCEGYENLLNHMIENHKDTIVQSSVFNCRQCNEPFTSRKDLIIHKRTMHYKKKKDMPCTQCSHVSQSKGNLKIHIMLKHMKSHFRCKICNISFRRSPQLKDHI